VRAEVLLHCSTPSCASLVYLDEAIPGHLIPATWGRNGAAHHGRYCLQCAHELGWWSEEDRERVCSLLKDAGLLGRPDDRRRRQPRVTKVSPDNGPITRHWP
jgi:hypothetical protein